MQTACFDCSKYSDGDDWGSFLAHFCILPYAILLCQGTVRPFHTLNFSLQCFHTLADAIWRVRVFPTQLLCSDKLFNTHSRCSLLHRFSPLQVRKAHVVSD